MVADVEPCAEHTRCRIWRSPRAMQMKRTVLVLLSFALALGAGVAAQRPPAWAPQADAIFADVADPGAAGCAMAVYRDGRIVYERGYGIADLEHDVPITPASVFYVGSLSKQFTAFAVALAASEGKLSIDDDVRKWLPELPDYGTRLDVGHLLHHTSGLRDYNTLFDIAGRRNDEAFDNQIVLGIIARQRALNFPPGEQPVFEQWLRPALAHRRARDRDAARRVREDQDVRAARHARHAVLRRRHARREEPGIRVRADRCRRRARQHAAQPAHRRGWRVDDGSRSACVGQQLLRAEGRNQGAHRRHAAARRAQVGQAADVRLRPADRQIPRVADRGARRIARWLPRASDPVS